MKSGKVKGILGIWMAVMCALALMGTALAAETQTLTISYPQNGAEFSVYRVADITTSGYVATSAFEGYAVALPTDGDWYGTASTLAAYVALDGIQADATATIALGYGKIEGLSEGLYLVVGTVTEDEDYIYTPDPCLVAVSGDTTVVVKYDRESQPDLTDYQDYSVTKVWVDGDSESRPDSVTVVLLCDGETYDTAVLSEENDWTCTWQGLDSARQWQLAEVDVAEGYTVVVTREEYAFTVTNTAEAVEEETPDAETTETETPDSETPDTETPGDDGDTTADTEDGTDTEDGSTVTQTGDTVQTGDDAPYMLLIALSVVAAGLMLAVLLTGRGREEEQE